MLNIFLNPKFALWFGLYIKDAEKDYKYTTFNFLIENMNKISMCETK